MFSNKLVVITGANRGIGFAATSALFTHGAQTVMACRNVELGRQSVREHRKVQGGPQPIVSPLDLSNLASVHEFAEGIIKRFGQAPDILINNAAVLLKDRHKNTKTVDGFDETFQVNYLAPALLTLLFLKEGIVAERIIHVSAGVHKTVDTQLNDLQLLSSGGGGGWDGWKAYCHSKRLQVLFSNKLARLAEGQGQPDPKFPLIPENQPMSICVDPGWVKTDLVRKANGWSEKEIEQKMGKASLTADAAVKTIIKACSHDTDVRNGDYLLNGRAQKQPTAPGMDDVKVQDELWERTKSLLKL